MEVGDYVRTKFGISRVKWFDNGEPILESGFTALQKEYKSSPNIIDLIEVGDYINGYKVINFGKCNGEIIGVVVDNDLMGFDIEDIKSIVTKEQFEEMKYEI